MLTDVLKAVKMLLSCCPKNSQDAVVLAALKAVQDAEKKSLPQRSSTKTYSYHYLLQKNNASSVFFFLMKIIHS
jgi:hypothetical protein